MGLFSKLSETKVYGSGNYLTPGTYVLEVLECRQQVSAQSAADDFVVLEYVVRDFRQTSATMGIRVPNGSGGETAGTAPAPTHRPGERLSHMINLKHPSALSNFKSFLLAVAPALAEVSDVSTWERFAEEAIGAENPLKAQLVSCRAVDSLTKGKRLPILKHNYEPFTGDPAKLPSLSAEDDAA